MSRRKFKNNCLKVRSQFWEFYSLYHLWFYLGDGYETYGYKRNSFVSESLSNKINYKFEEITDNFLKLVKDALEESIRSEMRYIFRCGAFRIYDAVDTRPFEKILEKYPNNTYWDDTYAIGNLALRELNKYLKKKIPNASRAISPKKAPISWAKIAFSWEKWSESYCGECWANACDIFLKADKLKTLSDKVAWIDNVLDMYHNNGPLLDKTAFVVLTEAGDLDVRAKLRSWKEILNNKSEINEFVESGSEHSSDYCYVRQREFPISSFTLGVIAANAPKLP